MKQLRLLLADVFISLKIRNVDNADLLVESECELEFEQVVTSNISTFELVEKIKQEV